MIILKRKLFMMYHIQKWVGDLTAVNYYYYAYRMFRHAILKYLLLVGKILTFPLQS